MIWVVHLGSRIRIPNTGAALSFPEEYFYMQTVSTDIKVAAKGLFEKKL
jgi:hypothetical protein